MPDFDQNLDFDGDTGNNNPQTGGDFFYCCVCTSNISSCKNVISPMCL